jgi:hypothetical protein
MDRQLPASPPADKSTPVPTSRMNAALRRRTLLRGGAGVAAPVLMTLSSGPVGATNAACTVASSFVSVITFQSRNPTVRGTSAQCSSGNVQTWRDLSLLPATGTGLVRPAALNVTVASYLGSTGSTFNTLQLWQVLSQGTGIAVSGELGTLQHLLALALSIQNGYVSNSGSVSVVYLQSVWVNYKSNGNRYKLPASNIDWGDTELLTWLRVLMGTMALP